MKAELYPKIASNTANNFISLVNRGLYNGLTFHRVINGSMIQGGYPDGNGMGDPGYSIKGESSQNRSASQLKHMKGMLPMAHAMDPSPVGPQFFTMHKNSPYLDGTYATFGKMTKSMDVVGKAASVRIDYNDRPMKGQKLKSVIADTFDGTYPEPEKC